MMSRMLRLVALVLLLSLTAAPAHAAGEIGLSPDGKKWSNKLAAPLFDSTVRWVPGDERTATFYVRNQSSSDALLDLVIEGSTVDDLMRTGDLTVTAQGGDSPWRAARAVGPQTMVQSQPLPPGTTNKMTITVAFAESSPNLSKRLAFDFNLRLSLTENTSGIVLPPGQNGSKPGNGQGNGPGNGNGNSGLQSLLPGTGNIIHGWWVALGLALTGGGAVLVARRRKEENHG